jgi:hypothetical protein
MIGEKGQEFIVEVPNGKVGTGGEILFTTHCLKLRSYCYICNKKYHEFTTYQQAFQDAIEQTGLVHTMYVMGEFEDGTTLLLFTTECVFPGHVSDTTD